MAHLLMIESFIGGNAVILPKLLKQMGHTYTFLTRSKTIYKDSFRTDEHVVIEYSDNIIEVNTNDILEVMKVISKERYDGIITTCDYYIDMVAEVSKELGVPCPFPETVKSVRYKHKLRQSLDAAELPNPKFALAYSWDEVSITAKNIGYPLVLKPVDLSSSAYVRMARNEEELHDAYQQLENFQINWRGQKRDPTYLLEEYMDGNEVSVEAVTFNGKTTIIGITQKMIVGEPYFIEDGHMFPANLSRDTRLEITDYVLKSLQAVKYDHGVSHTEVKLTSEGPRIVEINPRAAGGHIIEIVELVCKVDILRAFIDLSLGIKPTINNEKTDVTSACVRFLTPRRAGKIVKIEGVESLASDTNIVSYEVENCVGKILGDPIDNAGRIGRVLTKDSKGYNAMVYADEAIGRIKLTIE